MADLRKILADAKVSIPAKANKADLISLIIEKCPEAVGGNASKSQTKVTPASAPAPVPPTNTPAGKKPTQGDANAVATSVADELKQDSVRAICYFLVRSPNVL